MCDKIVNFNWLAGVQSSTRAQGFLLNLSDFTKLILLRMRNVGIFTILDESPFNSLHQACLLKPTTGVSSDISRLPC